MASSIHCLALCKSTSACCASGTRIVLTPPIADCWLAMARLTGPEVNQGAPYRYITCFSHAAACKGPISVTIHTGIAACPQSQSGDGPKGQPTSMQETTFFFFSRKWLASAARYYTRQQNTYRIVLHQSQHVALTSVSRYLQVGPWRMGDMSDPPSARISRERLPPFQTSPASWGFVSMVTDACAGDAILVCPGRGAPPSTVPYRFFSKRDHCRLSHKVGESLCSKSGL